MITKKREIYELKKIYGFGSNFGWGRVLDRIDDDGDKKVYSIKVYDPKNKFIIYSIGDNRDNALNKLVRSKKYRALKNKHKNLKLKMYTLKFLITFKGLDGAEMYEFGSTDIAILT